MRASRRIGNVGAEIDKLGKYLPNSKAGCVAGNYSQHNLKYFKIIFVHQICFGDGATFALETYDPVSEEPP